MIVLSLKFETLTWVIIERKKMVICINYWIWHIPFQQLTQDGSFRDLNIKGHIVYLLFSFFSFSFSIFFFFFWWCVLQALKIYMIHLKQDFSPSFSLSLNICMLFEIAIDRCHFTRQQVIKDSEDGEENGSCGERRKLPNKCNKKKTKSPPFWGFSSLFYFYRNYHKD